MFEKVGLGSSLAENLLSVTRYLPSDLEALPHQANCHLLGSLWPPVVFGFHSVALVGPQDTFV